MNQTLKRWLSQPTTILGIAVLLGAAAGVGVYLLTRNLMYAQGAGGAVAGFVLMVMQDNSADKSGIEKLVEDMVVSFATKRLAPGIVDDVKAVLAQPAPATATVTTTTTTAAPAA